MCHTMTFVLPGLRVLKSGWSFHLLSAKVLGTLKAEGSTMGPCRSRDALGAKADSEGCKVLLASRPIAPFESRLPEMLRPSRV